MGRHELPVLDGRLDEFARGLRDLRRRAGNPSYEVLAEESGYSGATLAAAASGRQLPPLTVTLAYVSACRGNVDAWADRWRVVSTEVADEDRATLVTIADEPSPPPATGAVRLPRRRPRARVVLLLAGLVAVTGTATVVLVHRGPEPPEVAQVPTEAPATSTPVLPPEFQETIGPGCRMDFNRYIHVSGAPGDDGWHEATGGSWTRDGCDGRFLYSTHPDNRFQWRFIFIEPAARRCRVEVFVPDSPFALATAWYDVADRLENIEQSVARFTIDQPANRGAWVDAGTVTIGTDTVRVQLAGTGAAGPVRLSCSRT